MLCASEFWSDECAAAVWDMHQASQAPSQTVRMLRQSSLLRRCVRSDRVLTLQHAACGPTTLLPCLTTDVCMQQLQALGETVGVVSRGASHDVMDMLHKTTYAEHNPDHAQEGCAEQ